MGRKLIDVGDNDLQRLTEGLVDLNEAAAGDSNDKEIELLWDWVESACNVLGISVPEREYDF